MWGVECGFNCCIFATVQKEGTRNVEREIFYYNLDMIISVVYRVNSLRGVQFRMWATSVLREYLIKGFTMNDSLLKNDGGGNYFDELLSRIRDIRSGATFHKSGRMVPDPFAQD